MKTFKTTINVLVNNYSAPEGVQKFDTSRVFTINAQKLVAVEKIVPDGDTVNISLEETITTEGLKSVPLRTFDATTIDDDTKQGVDNFFLGDLDNYELFFIDWALDRLGSTVSLLTLDDYKEKILKEIDPLRLQNMSDKED